MSDIDKAIEIIEHSQQTHVLWVKWFDSIERYPQNKPSDFDAIVANVGDKARHEEFIHGYQFVIDTLESLR